MADDKGCILPPESETLPDKKKLIGLGIFLSVVAVAMITASSVALNIMLKVTTVKELYSTVTKHSVEVEDTLLAFRVVVGILIVLAILQLITNAMFTLAAFKDKVQLIHRYNVKYSLVTILGASCFAVLVMTIIGTEIHSHKRGKSGMALFIVGIMHASISVYIFMVIENQKKEAAKKKLEAEEECSVTYVN